MSKPSATADRLRSLVVHQILPAQRQGVHDRLRRGDIAGIQQEDTPRPSPAIPLANFPVEIELHGLPDFGRHDGHDLFAGDAGFTVRMTITAVVRRALGFGQRMDGTWKWHLSK